MLIQNYNLSQHNSLCMNILDKSNTAKYSFIKEGISSYELNKEFLFDPILKPLLIDIQLSINEYISKFENLEASVISSSWFNVLSKGGVVGRHKHVDSWDNNEGSVVSGAYYPYVDKNSAALIFSFPNKNLISIVPESGALVIFPSWLDHYTKPNKSERRITVSFNTVRRSVVLEKFPDSIKLSEKTLKENAFSS